MHQLLETLAKSLKEKHWKLATAESCTGGLIAATITEIPGSSNWFERGFITYSNDSKIEMLDVNPEYIQQHGAVSEQVAKAMAQGALKNSKAQIALSVTGIAGPDGGSIDKPVGTVWFAFATIDGILESKHMFFQGNRKNIQDASCEAALSEALAILQKRK